MSAIYQLLPAERPPAVSASPEVVDHHLAQHRGRCAAERSIRWESPCGNVAVWQCTSCDELVIWAWRQWCEHAAEFWADYA
jgi:hypothetical protein